MIKKKELEYEYSKLFKKMWWTKMEEIKAVEVMKYMWWSYEDYLNTPIDIVSKLENTDTEESNSEDTIVPFQVAYAVSIHKVQWLEYDSVKIIISDEIWEKITHNIFYTAITRARENLTIYRSPQTSKKILDSLVVSDCNRDANILKEKL